MLKEEEYIGHEVYFREKPPQEIIDVLARTFIQSEDGFYIAREELELFRTLAHPYKVDIMQNDIILGGSNPSDAMDKLLDMINQLKVAGVQDIDNYIEKIK